jgi:hypothetical protein
MKNGKAEADVWKHFSRVWPWHSERLEPAFDSGLPDVLLKDIRGTAGFAELKAPDNLVLRPSQKTWIGRWQEKGSCAIPTVTCENIQGKIRWRVYRYPRMGGKIPKMEAAKNRDLLPALKKDEGKWLGEDEMIQLVLVMNGLEPYVE